MTNDRQPAGTEGRVAPPREDEPLSTALIAGALQPGDELPSEENRIRPPLEEPRREEPPAPDAEPSPERAPRPAPQRAPGQDPQPGPDRVPDRSPERAPAVDEATAGNRGAEPDEGATERSSLFGPEATDRYQARWRDVQTDFVDDPRRAVSQADQLVAEVMQALARTFSEERAGLEGQWDTGGDVSTEDLRIAMRRYRSFFSRLLSL